MRAVAKAHRRNRRPDHRAHPPRAAARAWRPRGVLGEEGVDPAPRRPRPQRRLHGRRPPQRAGRGRLRPRHGPLRHQPRHHVRGARRHRRRDVPPRLRRADGAVARRSCYIDWLAPGVIDRLPQWHYLHIERATSCPTCATTASPTSRSRRCSSAPRGGSSSASSGLQGPRLTSRGRARAPRARPARPVRRNGGRRPPSPGRVRRCGRRRPASP